MNTERHIVRKQVYELTLASSDGAHDIQQRLGRVHRDEVARVLADVMSSVGACEDVLLVEHLDLDLGRLAAATIEEQLAPRIGERFAESLAQTVSDIHNGGGGDPKGRRVPGEKAGIELLRSFLTTGTLPWWTPVGARGPVDGLLVDALENAEDELVAMLRTLDHPNVARRLVKQFPEAIVRQLITSLAGQSATALQQASSDWRSCLAELRRAKPRMDANGPTIAEEAIAALLAGRDGAVAVSEQLTRRVSREQRIEIDELIGVLDRIARRHLTSDRPLRRWLAEKTGATPVGAGLDDIARGTRGDVSVARPHAEPAATDEPFAVERAHGTGKDSDDEAITQPPAPGQLVRDRRTAGHEPKPMETRSARLPNDTAPKNPPDALNAPRVDVTRTTLSRTDGVPDTDRRRPSAREQNPADALHPPDEPARSDARRIDMGSGSVIDPEVGTIVENAGIVIAWPFLPRFFEQLELVRDDEFVSPGEQERALLLLQYLVAGEPEIPEHQLVLSKLLCGWPLEEPVAGRLEIGTREEDAIADLFSSILEHWKALGSTSPGGLRSSFFARQGLLNREQLGWNLKIERKGYDVLLDQLPWGIGFVMLPWMDDPLVVEW